MLNRPRPNHGPQPYLERGCLSKANGAVVDVDEGPSFNQARGGVTARLTSQASDARASRTCGHAPACFLECWALVDEGAKYVWSVWLPAKYRSRLGSVWGASAALQLAGTAFPRGGLSAGGG